MLTATRKAAILFFSRHDSSRLLRMAVKRLCASGGRLYTDKHEWIRQSGGNAVVGITDYAQKALGELVYVQLPEVGAELSQSAEACIVESVKAASDVYSPASGSVTEVNEALASSPSLVNKSCFDQGWLYKLKLSNVSELEKLMNEEKYEKFVKQLQQT